MARRSDTSILLGKLVRPCPCPEQTEWRFRKSNPPFCRFTALSIIDVVRVPRMMELADVNRIHAIASHTCWLDYVWGKGNHHRIRFRSDSVSRNKLSPKYRGTDSMQVSGPKSAPRFSISLIHSSALVPEWGANPPVNVSLPRDLHTHPSLPPVFHRQWASLNIWTSFQRPISASPVSETFHSCDSRAQLLLVRNCLLPSHWKASKHVQKCCARRRAILPDLQAAFLPSHIPAFPPQERCNRITIAFPHEASLREPRLYFAF